VVEWLSFSTHFLPTPPPQSEIEQLHRFVIAWEYLQAEETRVSAASAIEECKTRKNELENQVAQNKVAQTKDEHTMEAVKNRRTAVSFCCGGDDISLCI